MKIEEVVKMVAETIGDDTIEVSARNVTKENGVVRKGIMVGKKGDGIRVVVYVDDLNEEEDAVNRVMMAYKDRFESEHGDEERKSIEQSVLEIIGNKDKLLACVFPQVICKEKNEDKLKTAYWEEFLDLAVIYRVDIGHDGTLVLPKDTVDGLGITPEELREKAVENLEKRATSENIFEVLRKMNPFLPEPDDEEDGRMYVLSDDTGCFGSGLFVCTNFLKSLGDDYFILPSSIRELLRVNYDVDVQTLRNMVHDVNNREVDEEEFLSDNVYRFKDGKVEVA